MNTNSNLNHDIKPFFNNEKFFEQIPDKRMITDLGRSWRAFRTILEIEDSSTSVIINISGQFFRVYDTNSYRDFFQRLLDTKYIFRDEKGNKKKIRVGVIRTDDLKKLMTENSMSLKADPNEDSLES